MNYFLRAFWVIATSLGFALLGNKGRNSQTELLFFNPLIKELETGELLWL